jgi:hypothetical protein
MLAGNPVELCALADLVVAVSDVVRYAHQERFDRFHEGGQIRA